MIIQLKVFFVIILLSIIVRQILLILIYKRKKYDDSKLYIKFINLFTGLAVGPSIGIFIITSLFFNLELRAWYSGAVKEAVINSNIVAQDYEKEIQDEIISDTQLILREIYKCSNLDMEFDSISNATYQSNPSTNCSTNKNCKALQAMGSPKENPGWYFDTAKCPFEYYSVIKNPFEKGNNAFVSSYAIPAVDKIGYTYMNFDGGTGQGYKISTRYGPGVNEVITEVVEVPE